VDKDNGFTLHGSRGPLAVGLVERCRCRRSEEKLEGAPAHWCATDVEVEARGIVY
jgi:hypothetical protein